MENKGNGERKKLSLSSGGKLTLKNSIISNKPSNSIKANSRAGRGTVQVEVKRTKRLFNRSNINENSLIFFLNLRPSKVVNSINSRNHH